MAGYQGSRFSFWSRAQWWSVFQNLISSKQNRLMMYSLCADYQYVERCYRVVTVTRTGERTVSPNMIFPRRRTRPEKYSRRKASGFS